MIKAAYTEKRLVVNTLAKAFDANLSVNYIVKQDKKRESRISLFFAYMYWQSPVIFHLKCSL